MAVDISRIPVPPLPTLAKLNVSLSDDLDVPKIASQWLDALSSMLESNSPKTGVGDLFLADSWWRDMLSLTWDFRTFRGISSITTFLEARIKLMNPRRFKLRHDSLLGLERPYDDIAWINAWFDFETDTGTGLGIFRLVPVATGEWKAHTVFTNLEDLKGFPERIGPMRNAKPNHDNWEIGRNREIGFEQADPVVLVVGAGHSGLDVAARLKAYDVQTLIVERNERIGDNWRNRYDTLCLHDPVWRDHMPYLQFPSTWPVYTPARKLANWLEHYADALDLNVWTSSEVIAAVHNHSTGTWTVTVKRADGTERVLDVRHVIFTTGISGIAPKMPLLPRISKFQGQVLHSSQYKKALDHAGKKVVIVGACTSAHDIARDCYNHGIDVTMFQRGSTCVMSAKNNWDVLLKGLYEEDSPHPDIADRINASFPNFMAMGLIQRATQRILQMDRRLLESLHRRGFRTNDGIQGTGALLLVYSKISGFYLDVGASQLIADGRIKLKNDSQIKEFTETGLLFEDGSQLQADVVLFATGLGDIKENIRKVCGDKITDKCPPIWGFDKEGEINGIARELGTPGLWYFTGNFASCRFYSKHLALQIKAKVEGAFSERYSTSD
ncbi:hypothetical protein M378DRAFT_1042155 [Amanita muscaria Koide BX008]|uniref:FAD/NAD(P)-binding domain-containing protein n=1 Tax=Amanita muscaria (strain Koide BX008) TaxID=946122 RepID=A0A0C2WHE4_AMAMK|nr:hypothetical protein M378DRAFT_1042155 [Amanita muscaria Koide BX008]